jgi:cyclophilin family peptidyl-prolyl cis-trans isomerase
MTSNKILLICLAFIALTACNAGSKRQTNHHMENEKRTLVKLETTMGNITVALYNETPKHRDNFIKLVKEGVYDSTLFHRVIKQFMIQAGDPDSKNASDTAMLGSGDVGYTIPAEFNPKFFHKKGVLAAARQGDDVNPEKASSGCQFYIVTGRKFTEPQLLGMENKINEQREEALFDSLARQHMKEIYKMRKAGDNAGLLELQDTLEAQARELADKEEKFRFTPEQSQCAGQLGSQRSQFQLVQIAVDPCTDAQRFGRVLPDKLFIHTSHESHHIRLSYIGHQPCGHQAFTFEIQGIPIHRSVQFQIRIPGFQFQ